MDVYEIIDKDILPWRTVYLHFMRVSLKMDVNKVVFFFYQGERLKFSKILKALKYSLNTENTRMDVKISYVTFLF